MPATISMRSAPAKRSNVRRSTFVIRLPKRSTRSTSAIICASVDYRLRHIQRLPRRAAFGPNAVSSIPLASQAAAGRKPVASLERAADRRPGVPPLRQLDDALGWRLLEDQRQHAVVRRHEPIAAGLGGNRPPGRSDARIDHDDEDRAWRESTCRRPPARARRHDVVRRVCRG